MSETVGQEFESGADAVGARAGEVMNRRISDDEIAELSAQADEVAWTEETAATTERIDDALERTDDPAQRGSLYLARALANQRASDPSVSGSDASRAVPLLRASGRPGPAAFAAAAAAGMLIRVGDLRSTIDNAVEALTILDGLDQTDPLAIRANNATALLLSRLAAFDDAIECARRARAGVVEQLPSEAIGQMVHGTLASIAIQASQPGHLGPTYLDDARDGLEWMRRPQCSELSQRLLAPMIAADIGLLTEVTDEHLEGLDDSMEFRDWIAPIQVACHQLLRGSVLNRLGRPEEALEELDAALPVLRAHSEADWTYRALTERTAVHRSLGDLVAAVEDADARAVHCRTAERRNVGLFAAEIARRVEFEQARIELSHRAEELAKAADEDVLTGVGSRRWFDSRLDDLRSASGLATVLMVDLDLFKQVNDTFGHGTGDAVLQEVGATLLAVTRDDDIVARLGGEEFVIVMATGRDAAKQLAERIRREVEAVQWSGLAEGLAVTTSIGVATGRSADIDATILRADAALYRAKEAGRNRISVARSATSGPSARHEHDSPESATAHHG